MKNIERLKIIRELIHDSKIGYTQKKPILINLDRIIEDYEKDTCK